MQGFHKQRGITLVEFSVLTMALLMLIIGILEMGRFVYSWHLLNEITRRGARIAAVCQTTAAEIDDVINSAIPSTLLLPGFTPANLELSYLTDTGVKINGDLTNPTNFNQIRYIKAEINNYQYKMLLPFVSINLTPLASRFTAVVPRESLGINRFLWNTPTDC